MDLFEKFKQRTNGKSVRIQYFSVRIFEVDYDVDYVLINLQLNDETRRLAENAKRGTDRLVLHARSLNEARAAIHSTMPETRRNPRVIRSRFPEISATELMQPRIPARNRK